MGVAGFLEEVGRDVGLERPRPHPSGRPHTDVFFDDLGAFRNRAPHVVFPHAAYKLGIGATVADYVIAARSDLCDDLRIVVADRAVEQDRCRQLQLLKDFEQAPVADAVAIIAPSEIARRLLAAAHRVHAETGLKGEMLDVERNIEGEPLAARPRVVRPLYDWRVGVARVAGKFQHRRSPVTVKRLSGGTKHPAHSPDGATVFGRAIRAALRIEERLAPDIPRSIRAAA